MSLARFPSSETLDDVVHDGLSFVLTPSAHAQRTALAGTDKDVICNPRAGTRAGWVRATPIAR
jgi:hypothetical protein